MTGTDSGHEVIPDDADAHLFLDHEGQAVHHLFFGEERSFFGKVPAQAVGQVLVVGYGCSYIGYWF